MLPEVQAVATHAKLPLVDLALPGLRHLSPAQFQQFRAAVQKLVESDGEIDLFEYVLQKIVLRHLEPYFLQARKPVIQYYALKPLAPDCAVLLSALAYLGQDEPDKIEFAFQQGAQPLSYAAQAELAPAARGGVRAGASGRGLEPALPGGAADQEERAQCLRPDGGRRRRHSGDGSRTAAGHRRHARLPDAAVYPPRARMNQPRPRKIGRAVPCAPWVPRRRAGDCAPYRRRARPLCGAFALLAFALGAVAGTTGAQTKSVAPSVQLPVKEKLQLYLLMGQSNMAGRGKLGPEDQTPHPRVLVFTLQNQWEPAIEPITHDKPAILGVGPGLAFGKAMAGKQPGVTIGLVPCAFGGTPLKRWQRGGDLYSNAVHRATLAMRDGTLAGILWHQGEADAASSTNANTYAERLAQMIQ